MATDTHMALRQVTVTVQVQPVEVIELGVDSAGEMMVDYTCHRLVIDPAKDWGSLHEIAAAHGLSCECGSAVWMDPGDPENN